MLNVFNQNTDNFRFKPSFLTSFLLGSDLSEKKEQTSDVKKVKEDNLNELQTGDLEIIYAEDGDGNYDDSMDTNMDSRISYKEYLRYCEQNSKMEEKRSDTKINRDKNKFMTYSYGHAANAYNRTAYESIKGKVLSTI